jgi:uncharacterized protein YbjQ (UPF0145 family)
MQAAHCSAANILTQGFAVNPGDNIISSAWFRTAVTVRSVNVGVDFYDSTGTVIGGTLRGSDVSDSAANFLAQATASVNAPALSARCRANVQVKATGAGAEVHFTDDVLLGNGQIQTFWVVRSINSVVKTHAAGESVSLFRPPYLAM